MKKLFSLIIFLFIILNMSSVVFASENKVTLTYSNEASYEIVIPSAVYISSDSGQGAIELNIIKANLVAGSGVVVTATSSNYSNGSWYLINIEDNRDRLEYSIGSSVGGSDISSGDIVIVAHEAASITLYITLQDAGRVGTFMDTITFVSGIEEINI